VDQTQVLANYALQVGVIGSQLGQGAAVAVYFVPLLLVLTVFALRSIAGGRDCDRHSSAAGRCRAPPIAHTWPAQHPVAGLAMALYTLVTVFPFYWMFITVFKVNSDLYNTSNNPLWFNQPPHSPIFSTCSSRPGS